MNTAGDTTVEQALALLVEMANALPGAFSAEVALGYLAGVVDDKRWTCEVEADIYESTSRSGEDHLSR